MSTADRLDLSIIVCTHDPEEDLLRRALASIAGQDLDRSRFETILVDNASDPAVDLDRVSPDPTLEIRSVREPKLGHTNARLCGIAASCAKIVLFVDDDNELAPDYASTALRIAAANPTIGAFGGVAEGVFDAPVPGWKKALLPYLGVRDYGAEEITSETAHWGQWDPIGAGLVTRRDVAEHYSDFVQGTRSATGIGRVGKALMSGDDTLIARCANQKGYACSYQPALRLKHHIERWRLDNGYLRRLLEGHGRTYVRLERIQGRDVAPVRGWPAWWFLIKRWFFRIAWAKRAGLIIWRWDLGYVRETRDGAAGHGVGGAASHVANDSASDQTASGGASNKTAGGAA